jgi:hypothetical protein
VHIPFTGTSASELFAALESIPLVNDILLGAGFGAIVGKLVVHRVESRRGEVPPRRVRQLDLRWIGFGAGAATALSLGVRLLLG